MCTVYCAPRESSAAPRARAGGVWGCGCLGGGPGVWARATPRARVHACVFRVTGVSVGAGRARRRAPSESCATRGALARPVRRRGGRAASGAAGCAAGAVALASDGGARGQGGGGGGSSSTAKRRALRHGARAARPRTPARGARGERDRRHGRPSRPGPPAAHAHLRDCQRWLGRANTWWRPDGWCGWVRCGRRCHH